MRLENLNVVIMAYSRPEHFRKVLSSCESKLEKVTVYLDKPANNSVAEEQDKILEIIQNSSLNCELHRRTERLGLAGSILTAVAEQVAKKDHVVILEDDCVPLDGFFEFMLNSIHDYRDDDDTTAVCATRTACPFNPWGWATWSHKWKYKKFSAEEILQTKNMPRDLVSLLKQNPVDGEIWSLSWLTLQYLTGKVSCYPKSNLVQNIGLDHTGVHSHKEGYTKWLNSKIMENSKD